MSETFRPLRLRATGLLVAATALAATVAAATGGPTPIRLAAAPTATAGTLTTEDAATAGDAALTRLAGPFEHRFTLTDAAAFDAGEATAYRYLPPADVGAATARLAAELGVDGTPRVEGGGATVGATDGTGRSLWVGAAGDWSYSDPAGHPARVDCVAPAVEAEPLPADDLASEDDATVENEPSGDATVEPAPDRDVMPAPPCPEPTPPANVPSASEAREAAAAFLARVDLPGTPTLTDVHADEWGAWVAGTIPIDGVATDLHVSVAFGADGIVTAASGTLAAVEPADRYPTVDAATAVERLAELHTGVRPLLEPLVDPATGAADAPATGTAEAPAVDLPRVAPDTPVSDTPAPDTPASDAPVSDLDDEVTILPAPGPDGPPEVVEVTLVSSAPALELTPDADGDWWLLPAIRFTDQDGGRWQVVAISDELLEVEEPAAEEPAPDAPPAEQPPVEPTAEPMPLPEPAEPLPVEPDPAPAPTGPDPAPGTTAPAPGTTEPAPGTTEPAPEAGSDEDASARSGDG